MQFKTILPNPGYWLLAFLLLPALAFATHGRYGTMNYKNLGPVGPDSCEIEVTVSQAWEICAAVCFYPGPPPSPGDVSPATSTLVVESAGGAVLASEPITLTVTTVNLPGGWFFGEYKTTLTVHCDSAYKAFYDGCCRISSLVNNADGDYHNEVIIPPASGGNSSPVATLPPIVKVPLGKVSTGFAIGAADPDGDPLLFRLASPLEAADAGSVNAPGFSVTPAGMASLPTLGYAPDDLLNAWVAIEDGKGSIVILDFLIEVVDSSAPPVFIPPTPPAAPCLLAYEGDPFSFPIAASDPDVGDIVKISAVGLPPGSSLLPSLPTPGGNPEFATFDWTPGAGSAGIYVITFTAEDTSGVSALTSVCVEVLDTVVEDSCVSVSIVCEADSSWMKSTTTELGPWGGTWAGATSLPATATYTMPVSLGQPYPWANFHPVDGSPIIKAENNVTFYRKELEIANPSDVEMRLRMTMDDGVEVYLNGYLLVREENSLKENWQSPVHDILYASDGTITNGNAGGQSFDLVSALDLDSIFMLGTNELVVALYNRRPSSDKGGFSMKLEAEVQCPATDSCVSDSTWDLSTVMEVAPWGGDWAGASALPDDSTYTLKAMEGMPYPWGGLNIVTGTKPIKADNNVRFYRKCFEVTDNKDVDARIRMYMDDGVEVYLNGYLLVHEENSKPENWFGVPHDIEFNADGTVDNGANGNQAFDYASGADLDSILIKGENCLVLALYNLRSSGNKGGFSFRLDMTKGGAPVLVPLKRQLASVVDQGDLKLYPNPTLGFFTIVMEEELMYQKELTILDMSGKILAVESVAAQVGEVQLDISDYPEGVYLIRVESELGIKMSRIMKH